MNRLQRLQFLAAWFLLGLVPLFIRPLWEPDEGRYAEIPREMLASGDWLTPRLNGVLYFEKPPLQYWLSAISMKAFGLHAFAARLPLALAWAITMYCAWKLATRLKSRRPMWAVWMAGTSFLGFVTGQILTLDALFTAFLLLSLTAALEAVTADHEARPHLGWTLLSFAALAFSTLTKGIAAPVLIGGVLLLSMQLAWTDQKIRKAVLKIGFHPLGWLLFLSLATPWFWFVNRANPGHANFFFIHEHFARFASHVHGRQGSSNPWLDKLYFILILGVGLVPWLSMSVVGIKRTIGFCLSPTLPNGDEVRLLRWSHGVVLWAAVWPLVFFTFSGSKLPPYILPSLVPVLALACAWNDPIAEASSRRRTALELLMVSLVLILATIAFSSQIEGATWIFITAGAYGFLAIWAQTEGSLMKPPGLAALAACTLLLTFSGHRAESKSKDCAPLVAFAPEEAQWISLGVYFQGLPFHARQRVVVVAGTGELAFGRDHLDLSERERWFQEDAAALVPTALRMRSEAPARPVMVLAKLKMWGKEPLQERSAFDEVARSGRMILLRLK